MNTQNFDSLQDIYDISKNFNLDMRNKRNTIRLNESMLHRIIKESVKNVLNEMEEATNGWTERAFNNLYNDIHEYDSGLGSKRKRYNSGSGDGNYDKADPAYKARKKRALDYLGNRWQRENNYSDDSVDRICNYAYGDNDPHFEDSDLTSNQLRRLGKQPKQDFGKLAYHQQKHK